MENIYKREGFKNRTEYLKDLADSYGVDFGLVAAAAQLLGENEDFDGLINTIEDLSN